VTALGRNGRERPARAPRSALNILGLVLVVTIVVAGLALLACVIFFYVAFSTYGSNK
jgi:hypothetical protein